MLLLKVKISIIETSGSFHEVNVINKNMRVSYQNVRSTVVAAIEPDAALITLILSSKYF